MVCTLIPAVASAQTDTSMENTSEQNICEFIQSYLDFVCTVKSDYIVEKNQWNVFFNISDQESSEALLKEKMLVKAYVEHCKLQRSDLRYSDFENKISWDSIATDGKTAKVNITVDFTAWFHDGRDPEMGFANPETFMLKMGDKGWYIVSREYNNDFEPFLKSLMKSENDWESAVEQCISISAEERVKEDAALAAIIEEYGSYQAYEEYMITHEKELNERLALESAGTRAFTYYTYNRGNAVSFANDYVNSTSYPSPYHYYAEDCTNFTSICLKYGNIKDDDVGTYQWYFHSTTDKTAEFTAARYFRNYYVNNVGSTSIKGLYSSNASSWTSLQRGDIVQLYSDGLAYHSMIVVLVEYDPSTSMPSDLKIAQHTQNGYYWLSTKPSSRYYRIIRGSYT